MGCRQTYAGKVGPNKVKSGLVEISLYETRGYHGTDYKTKQ